MLALSLASCGSGSFEDKKECYDERVKPLVDRANLGDAWAHSRLNPEQLNRFADECGMTDDEKSRLFSKPLDVQALPTTRATPSPTGIPSNRPSSWPTATPTPTISVIPGPTQTPSSSPSATPSVTPTPTATPTPSVTVTPIPTTTPTATPTATPSPTPSVTVTPVPSVTPTPTTTVTPSFPDVPQDDEKTLLAALKADGYCRVRRLGPGSGTNKGFHVLIGNRIGTARPQKTLQDAVTIVRNEKARLFPACKALPAVSMETCSLRYRSFTRAGTYGGYYAAIENNDLSETGARNAADATRLANVLVAEKLCTMAPTAGCQIVQVFAPQPGYVVVSDQMGWLHDAPTDQATANTNLSQFKTAGYCK